MRKSKSKRDNLNGSTPLDYNVRDNLQSNHEDKGYRNKKIRDAGRRALKNGQTLERLITILGVSESCKDVPLFELIRNYDAMQKSYGKNGQLGAHTTGPSNCDFSFWTNGDNFGWITGGMIEAKSRESGSINKSAVSDHQKKQLIRMEKLGQLGLILVKIMPDLEPLYFIIPISHWFRGDKKSHNEKDLKALGYKLDLIEIHDEVTNTTVEVPDLFSVLQQIDEEGNYKKIPAEYAELSDNKKLKNVMYSTLEKDFETLDVEIDDY